MPQGWTEWKEVTDPEGSPIPDLDEEHPYLQWRVLFSSDDINSLPVLKEVKLLPGPPAVEEEVSSVPRETLLHQNYPNPFNTQTVIRYQLSEGGYVRLAVYDVVGHRVRVLEEGEFPAGYYRVVWDGKNEGGKEVGSGIYLFILETGGYRRVVKGLLLR